MNATLSHRGPDDAGLWQTPDQRVGLAHRRLAIVDLSPLGHNPMLRDNGRLAITFNGEIYNFRELRRDLIARGHQFVSQTDTEVILAAYDEWGLAAVERFAGMFAFALWDEPRGRLWIGRDRLGKKPLYYSYDAQQLLFGSELKALLVCPTFSRALDSRALSLYLKYGYIPAPYSVFSSARRLLPGHQLVYENGVLREEAYWQPSPHTMHRPPATEATAIGELEQRLSLAVEERRIADVPLGAFLSGGIDSSLVVGLMAAQSATQVSTYTISFADREFDESSHAAAVAKHLGTAHHEHQCTEDDLLAVVDRLPEMFDEPFADSSAIPTFLVSQAARQHVTVALSGDGGDEVFLGYPRYAHLVDAQWAMSLPRPIRRAVAAGARHAPTRRLRRVADVLEEDDADLYSRFITWFPTRDVEQMTGIPFAPAPQIESMVRRTAQEPLALRPAWIDLVSYLPDDILAKVDRTSMAVALEVRAPLLDHRVVEFAMSLPLGLKRRRGTSKWILRELLARFVPRELTERPKMGFGVPLAQWFAGPLKSRMDLICAPDSDLFRRIGIDAGPLLDRWSQFKAGGHPRADLLWQGLMLAEWSRRFTS